MQTGPPQPPDPKLDFHFPYDLEIQWAVPFSHDTIQGYNVEIVSESSMGFAVLDNVTLHNDTNYTFSFENQNNVSKCHTLTINVTAVSELGEGIPGNISRGFPTGKYLMISIMTL